jgi:sucrose-6-phosphate hydrolase SacC (GH32 family)
MFAQPVRELERLRGRHQGWTDRIVKPTENLLSDRRGTLFDIQAELALNDAARIEFNLRGVPVVYDVKKQTITCRQVTAPLPSLDGTIRLRLLVDRRSLELFGNDGRVAVSVGIDPDDSNRSLGLSSHGGSIRLRALDVYELHSAWTKASD